jgi:hypothetical protein
MATVMASPTYRRVVVALDASRGCRAALDSAAALANAMGAELVGLFIEDVNQVRLGQLPFTRLAGPGAVSHEIDHATVERLMQRAARDVRARLEQLAGTDTAPARWSFQVVRGVVGRELKAAAHGRDLVVVDDTAFAGTAREGLADIGSSVLCVRPDGHGAGEVIVQWGKTARQRRALATAASLARASERTLTVLADATVAAEAIAEGFGGLGIEVRMETTSAGSAGLMAAAKRRPGAVVVLSADDDSSRPLLDDRRYSVLIVR